MKNSIKVTTKIVAKHQPDENALTDVCITNQITELRVMENTHNVLKHFMRISKDEYCDKRTGEVKQYNHSKTKQNHERNLNRTFEKLRQLINANFTGEINELHVTLTYAEKMEDFEAVSKDFKRFWDKLHSHYPELEYIRVIEPQHTGTWHIHLLLKSTNYQYLTISHDELVKLWGLGYVYVNKIKNNDNIGAYFTALHKNVNAFENDSVGEIDKQCIVKGARFQFYPPNKRFYGNSKGIVRPTTFKTTYKEALQLVDEKDLVFSSSTEIVLENTETQENLTVNTISRLQYNAKRNKKGE